jgi:nucleotide-binding universal stress UspA family protein
MLKNILVPLDGSPVSEAALPYAVALASRTGAGLTLVRAVQAPVLSHQGESAARAIASAEAYLASFAHDLSDRGFDVQTGVPYGRSAPTWIVEEISMRHADLVVMATHGRSGLERWVRGSVAEGVVHAATVPVLLVHAAEGLRPIERFDQPQPVLVVALDGSELAEAALPTATELAAALGGRLVLMGAVPEAGRLVAAEGGIGTYAGADHERLLSEAREYLEAIASRLKADGIKAESALRIGEAAVEIATFALEQKAAAIVMATHGRTGLARTILGSVAGGVVHHSTSPVILVRPGGLRPAEQAVYSQMARGLAPA